ncbi:hypothetical protein [Geobacillus sp. C56-T2]|uniref:hypothetical protein n=1 Tax=Geobacillus sp. C56-T2 TaxID=600773 RepID=UPI002105032A|nr:hypothetical protein [Geobacillus sp. C56-T2]
MKAKKKSLPILYMLASKRDNLLKQYFSNHIDYSELYARKEKVIQQMEQEGAFYYAKVISQIYKEKAWQDIEKLDVGDKYKSALKTFICNVGGEMCDARNHSLFNRTSGSHRKTTKWYSELDRLK